MIQTVKPSRRLVYGHLPIRTDIPCIEVLGAVAENDVAR